MPQRSYRWLFVGLAVVGLTADLTSKYGVFRYLYPGESAALLAETRTLIESTLATIARLHDGGRLLEPGVALAENFALRELAAARRHQELAARSEGTCRAACELSLRALTRAIDSLLAELLPGPRIEVHQLAFLDEAVHQHLREAVGRGAGDEHVLRVLEHAHRNLPPVVGVGRIGVGLAARIENRQQHPAAERRRRGVAAVGRPAIQRDLPRRRQVLPVPPGP